MSTGLGKRTIPHTTGQLSLVKGPLALVSFLNPERCLVVYSVCEGQFWKRGKETFCILHCSEIVRSRLTVDPTRRKVLAKLGPKVVSDPRVDFAKLITQPSGRYPDLHSDRERIIDTPFVGRCMSGHNMNIAG